MSYVEAQGATETYGFVGSQGTVNLEGVLFRPQEPRSNTVFLMMHPSSTLQLLPLPAALADAGYSVLCMGSRYVKNDTPLIFEKVVLDLGACIRHARQELGFGKVVLLGWSGGGSLAMLYQSQAEVPTIADTPAGDPVRLCDAKLLPADGVILEAAHRSRAFCLKEWIDPSILDEGNPDRRNPELDLYSPSLPVRPPYPKDWLAAYRQAQIARIRRITEQVQETLGRLRRIGGLETERGFVTHRTMADPRFLDGTIDPNQRQIGRCYLGVPETVNSGPVGLARFAMLRSWLSQWSLDHTRADGVACAPHITVPLLAIEHTGDDAVPEPDVRLMYEATGSKDKIFRRIDGANHYFKGQPEHLSQAIALIGEWAKGRGW